MRDFFDADNNLKPLVDQPAHVLKGIIDLQIHFSHSGEYDENGLPKIEVLYKFKFHDKLKVLKKLGDHVGAFIK